MLLRCHSCPHIACVIFLNQNQGGIPMLRIEYEMLTFINQHPGCSWSDVLNAFDPASQCRVTDAVLSAFLSQGLISAVPPSEKPPVCRVRLYPSAVQLILLYEEEQRRQKRRTNVWRSSCGNSVSWRSAASGNSTGGSAKASFSRPYWGCSAQLLVRFFRSSSRSLPSAFDSAS